MNTASFPLPPEMIRHVRAYLDNLAELHASRDLLLVPDTFWKDASSRLYNNPLKDVKGKRNSFAYYFEQRVIPLLCIGCGKTTNCTTHLIYDGKICSRCERSDEYRIVSMTSACQEFFLPRECLHGGVRVSARYYDCTMYLWTDVRDIAIKHHGSIDRVYELHREKEERRKYREKRREEIIQEEEEAEERRQDRKRKRDDAVAVRKARLDSKFSRTDFWYIINQTYTNDFVFGDYLSNKRLCPSTSFTSVVENFERVEHLYKTVPLKCRPYIREHLSSGLSLEQIEERERRSIISSVLTTIIDTIHRRILKPNMSYKGCLHHYTCNNYPAQACPFNMCKTHCNGCNRHKK